MDGSALTFSILVVSGALALKPPSLQSCWHHWLKMTDSNYNKAIQRYAECSGLAGELDRPQALRYRRSLIRNIQRTSNYFFEKTTLEPNEVVRVLRSVAKLVENIDNDECRPNDGNELNQHDDFIVDDGDKFLFRAQILFWAFVVLVAAQAILIGALLWIVCCSDLVARQILCGYHDPCVCDDEPDDWITSLLDESQGSDECVEACPALVKHQPRTARLGNRLDYGTNFGRRISRDENILSDMTSLTSSGVGSDSEFEALMKRRPLLKSKRKSKTKS